MTPSAIAAPVFCGSQPISAMSDNGAAMNASEERTMRRRAKTAIAARTIVPTGVLPKIKIVKRDVAREERRDQDDVSAREMGVAFAERDIAAADRPSITTWRRLP